MTGLKQAAASLGGRAGEAAARIARPGSVAGTALRRLAPEGSATRHLLARAKQALVPPAEDPVWVLSRAFGAARPDAFFVQIGAHDGTQIDPLDEQIETRAWRGIMLEPIPDVFERLRARHSGNPRLILENAALSEEDGTREIYYLPQSADPNLPPWYDALASFRKDVLLKHVEWIPDIEQRIAAMAVPCVTFDTLCRRHAIERIDLIQIDTEGYDFEIIKQIDLDRYRPTLVICEHIHLDAGTLEACIRHMNSAGYEDLRGGMDMLFLRVDGLGPKDARLARCWRALRNAQGATPSSSTPLVHAKRMVNAALGRVGLRLVRAEPLAEPSARGDGGFDPRFHDPRRPLPAGAEERLRSDHPRLVELRRSYAQLGWPVGERSRWAEEAVQGWLNLRWFRGENLVIWHYRQSEQQSRMLYYLYLRYVLERDPAGLVATLGEDGAFGCWTFEFPGYPNCSRDLLDSVNEIYFLDRHLSVLSARGLRVLDIGAGYGRLAHRLARAVPGLADYCCLDAIPEMTFLSEYYLDFRGVVPPARVVPLPEVPELHPGAFDLACNVHSFSEQPRASVEWWMGQLRRLQVRHFFLVPNEPEGFLTTEADGSRLDYGGVIAAHGYRLVHEEPVLAEPALRQVTGLNDRFCLFELGPA